MAQISAKMVKELREATGAGMMDCKKALVATDGNMEEAIDFLRKSGEAKAVKKAGRIAAEGIVMAEVKDGKVAAIVEVNSETDFVAKNADFQGFVKAVVDQAIATENTDMAAFMAEPWIEDETKTVNDALINKIAVIGEKLSIRRFEKVTTEGTIVSYIHGGGRIGVLVVGEGAEGDAVTEALTNIAMQVAAMNPQYISRSDISADEMAKLREITIDSSLNDPANLPRPILMGLINKAIADKIWSDEDIAIYEEKKSKMQFLFNFLSEAAVNSLKEIAMADKENIMTNKIFAGAVEGRISKQVKEISLYDQAYVKAEDGKQTVAKYIESVDKALKIAKIVRFETGEGIEKKQEDFAAEVAAQMGN